MHTKTHIVDEITKHCNDTRKKLLLDLLTSEIGRKIGEAPASTAVRFHHAYDGGLYDHICEIIDLGIDFASKAVGNVSPQAVITVAILHDLNKVGDSKGNAHYIPNLSEKTGKRSEAEPYKKDKDECRKWTTGNMEIDSILKFAELSDGEQSLALLTKIAPDLLMDLTPSEINAIRFHDGGYGKAKYASGYCGKEDNLAIIIHAADMISSRARNN
jgi:hypothetical protein